MFTPTFDNAVIRAHNHPPGASEPGRHRLHEDLRDALGMVDVRVLDDVVCRARSAVQKQGGRSSQGQFTQEVQHDRLRPRVVHALLRA